MKNANNRLAAMAAVGALGLGLGFSPAKAQTKPDESTSKVKKVLLYNKCGGWVHTDGIADVKTVMTRLAAAKKFELTQLADDGSITLDYLKGFNVIVWNNNTNGQASVPSANARKAVIDYVNGGGGWMLIHGAGDHGDTWTELKTALGTKFTTHGNQGPAEADIDPAAKAHKEVKWMVQGIPDQIKLTDEWYSFQNTVRPLSGVTVVATAKATGTANVINPIADGSNDLTYIWTREIGKGRLVYNAIGHGQNQLMAQQDSVAPKFYWQNLRYAAGDFQNGCTKVGDSKYDAAARVDDGSCAGGTGIKAPGAQTDFFVSKGGEKIRINFFHNGDVQLAVRDLRGAVVWKGIVNASSNEVSLTESIRPGAYQLEAREGSSVYRTRVVL